MIIDGKAPSGKAHDLRSVCNKLTVTATCDEERRFLALLCGALVDACYGIPEDALVKWGEADEWFRGSLDRREGEGA